MRSRTPSLNGSVYSPYPTRKVSSVFLFVFHNLFIFLSLFHRSTRIQNRSFRNKLLLGVFFFVHEFKEEPCKSIDLQSKKK